VNTVDTSDLTLRLAKLDNSSYSAPPTKTVAGITVGQQLGLKIDETQLAALPEEDLTKLDEWGPKAIQNVGDPKLKAKLQSIPDHVFAKWEVRWSNKAQRLAIPIRDCNGKLVGISGRAMHRDQKPKFLHSTGFSRDYYLYGEQFIDPSHKKVYLVEGFWDVMWIVENGWPNCLGVMGSYLSKFQVEKIVRWADEVIIIPDGDGPGYEAAARWEKELTHRLPSRTVKVPDGSDPDELHFPTLVHLLGPPPALPKPELFASPYAADNEEDPTEEKQGPKTSPIQEPLQEALSKSPSQTPSSPASPALANIPDPCEYDEEDFEPE
jgi:hypothetical protein